MCRRCGLSCPVTMKYSDAEAQPTGAVFRSELPLVSCPTGVDAPHSVMEPPMSSTLYCFPQTVDTVPSDANNGEIRANVMLHESTLRRVQMKSSGVQPMYLPMNAQQQYACSLTGHDARRHDVSPVSCGMDLSSCDLRGTYQHAADFGSMCSPEGCSINNGHESFQSHPPSTPGAHGTQTNQGLPMQVDWSCLDAAGSAEAKKRAGKRSAVKRGTVRSYAVDFGKEIPLLEGSWVSEKFMSASLRGPSATHKLVLQLADAMLQSLSSLYLDGIKPWLGDVSHRLRPNFQHLLTLAEVKWLAEMCGDKVILMQEMRCKGEEGCVVYLTQEPAGFVGFVDIHNSEDPFTKEQWRLFHQHMISLMQHDSVKNKEKPYEFRGGRYAFAELMQKSVKEFGSMRLGELCHMVQLAIQNGALTYVNCVLQPSSACFSKTRAITQTKYQPKESKYPVCQSIEEAMQIIALLADDQPEGLVLAQLKQKFQREFNRDLDPEVFGHTKLQHLLLSLPFTSKYRLYTPRNSPHRTIVQHVSYPLPFDAALFKPETMTRTRFDMVADSMSPRCYLSNVSYDFLNNRQFAWAATAPLYIDDVSWTAFLSAIPYTDCTVEDVSTADDESLCGYTQHPSGLGHLAERITAFTDCDDQQTSEDYQSLERIHRNTLSIIHDCLAAEEATVENDSPLSCGSNGTTSPGGLGTSSTISTAIGNANLSGHRLFYPLAAACFAETLILPTGSSSRTSVEAPEALNASCSQSSFRTYIEKTPRDFCSPSAWKGVWVAGRHGGSFIEGCAQAGGAQFGFLDPSPLWLNWLVDESAVGISDRNQCGFVGWLPYEPSTKDALTEVENDSMELPYLFSTASLSRHPIMDNPLLLLQGGY